MKGYFVSNENAMVRRNMGLKHWSAMPTGKMFDVSQGNGTIKRETHVKAEGDSKKKNRITLEKKKNVKRIKIII